MESVIPISAVIDGRDLERAQLVFSGAGASCGAQCCEAARPFRKARRTEPAMMHADTCLEYFSAPLILRTQPRKGTRPSAVRCTAPTAWSSARPEALSTNDALPSAAGAS